MPLYYCLLVVASNWPTIKNNVTGVRFLYKILLVECFYKPKLSVGNVLKTGAYIVAGWTRIRWRRSTGWFVKRRCERSVARRSGAAHTRRARGRGPGPGPGPARPARLGPRARRAPHGPRERAPAVAPPVACGILGSLVITYTFALALICLLIFSQII